MDEGEREKEMVSNRGEMKESKRNGEPCSYPKLVVITKDGWRWRALWNLLRGIHVIFRVYTALESTLSESRMCSAIWPIL